MNAKHRDACITVFVFNLRWTPLGGMHRTPIQDAMFLEEMGHLVLGVQAGKSVPLLVQTRRLLVSACHALEGWQ